MSTAQGRTTYRSAEFFAGIGLVGMALRAANIETVWSNDIEPVKERLFAANFDADHYRLGDVRDVHGRELPSVHLATASFPCTDLSLAGWRKGLAGDESSMLWEFARVLDEMDNDRPPVVLLENVPAFATSHGGSDLRSAIVRLNELGYWCDLFQIDARLFVAQSRPRLFIVGSRVRYDPPETERDWHRPSHLVDFVRSNPDLLLHSHPMPMPERTAVRLRDAVERFPATDEKWWNEVRLSRFLGSLSPIQKDRVERLRHGSRKAWRTAYRRTRHGVAVWEVRPDAIAGCLRTARGGSSKQAVVEGGRGEVRVRWMTAREYARLQGVPDSFDFADLSANKVMFGFGDAVCVPAVEWIAREYVRPLLTLNGKPRRAADAAA